MRIINLPLRTIPDPLFIKGMIKNILAKNERDGFKFKHNTGIDSLTSAIKSLCLFE